jgi:hypothetical protein
MFGRFVISTPTEDREVNFEADISTFLEMIEEGSL